MSAEKKDMIHLIDGVRTSLKHKRLTFHFLVLLSSTALVFIILGKGADYLKLREDQQFAVFVFLAIPFAILVFKGLSDYFRRALSRQEIALKVEEATPELMDSYVCAMEICERGGARGRIEEALVAKVSQRFVSGEIKKLVTPAYLSKNVLSALLVLSLVLLIGLWGNPIFAHSFSYLKYQKTGIHEGLSIHPGDVKIPLGSDLKITATITKGEQAAVLEYKDSGDWKTLEMIKEDETQYSVVLYSVESEMSYRVITPSIKSQAYTVSVYLEPVLNDFSIDVSPPSYTGKPSFKVSEIANFAIPEKSNLTLQLGANKAVKFELSEGESKLPLNNDFSKSLNYQFRVPSTTEYTLQMTDSAGHKSVTEPFKISVVRDMPPHIEVSSPAKDLQKTKFDIVTLEVAALDDYGLESVELFIEYSFGSSEKYTVFKSSVDSTSKEENLFHDLNLKKLGLSEGDVITYYFEAKDNCQPEAQAARTKIYFLEIRPDENDVQDDEEQDGDEQQGELSVNDLIASQKDLIRSLIDKKASADVDDQGKYSIDDALVQELSSQTATLRLAVKKRMDKLLEEAEKMGAGLGEIGEWFESSVKNLQLAEKLTQETMLKKALGHNNKSLSDLIKIAIELEKNSQKSKSKSQDPKNEEQQQQDQERQQERLADMLEKLEDLEDQQEEINDQLKNMEKDDLQEQQSVQEKMSEQQERLEDMADSLEEQQQQEASQQMQQASEQQQKASQQMQQGNSEGAQQQSQQAKQRIAKAKNEIKRAMRDQARQQLKQLADRLDQTVEKQEELTQQTKDLQNLGSEEAKKELAEQKKQQDEIQREMQGLMDQLGAAANELDEKYPEVAEALRESREFASNQGIDRRLKRASNALHYRRQSSAVREQEKASDAMSMLGHKVRDAVSRLPKATLEELLQMRQQLENARRQTGNSSGMSTGQLTQQTTSIQQMLENMGEDLQDANLQFTLPDALEAMKREGQSGANIVKGQMSALNQAAFILDRLISKADLEKRLTLNKRTGNAPDKYKRSVREYLKSLSDEKE